MYNDSRVALIGLAGLVLGLGALNSNAVLAGSDNDALTRNLTVEQKEVYQVKPASTPHRPGPGDKKLKVTAWVDKPDNTYASGESVGLFVRSNKEAYVTVINVGPSGDTTVLFPNGRRTDNRARAGQDMRVLGGDDGPDIKVGPPFGVELIKVIASTQPTPVLKGGRLSGHFRSILNDNGQVTRNLQVVMKKGPARVATYDKVIRTVAARPQQGAARPQQGFVQQPQQGFAQQPQQGFAQQPQQGFVQQPQQGGRSAAARVRSAAAARVRSAAAARVRSAAAARVRSAAAAGGPTAAAGGPTVAAAAVAAAGGPAAGAGRNDGYGWHDRQCRCCESVRDRESSSVPARGDDRDRTAVPAGLVDGQAGLPSWRCVTAEGLDS